MTAPSVQSDPCDQLETQLAPYLDGELDAAAQEAYALHLASCGVCRDGLHDAMQLIAVEARAQRGAAPIRELRPREARARVRRWNRRTVISLSAGAVALAAVVAIVVTLPRVSGTGGLRDGDGPVALQTAPRRALEGRLSYAPADRHRRYDVPRAAGSGAAPGGDVIGLPILSKLESGGDLQGVAAAYVLLGEPARALTYLDRAPASPAVAADRALVLLVTGKPADALVALDEVLAASPTQSQAWWNRALALRDLGLPRMAYEAFGQAAAFAEPGWADEARTRAEAIRNEADQRKARHAELLAAGARLRSEPTAMPLELARQIPGFARVLFYDAVRSAPTADRVRQLAPLAQAIDAADGDDALARYLARIAEADFAVRGPLAVRYGQILAGEQLDETATEAYLAALRRAKQDDILIGALLICSADRRTVPPSRLPEYRHLAQATGEPWFAMLAAEQEANALLARDDAEAAEAVARPAYALCATSVLDLRCARLANILGDAYLAMLRPSDARRVIEDGMARARRAGEWHSELAFLSQLGTLEIVGDDVAARGLPLARAYLGERLLRDPQCKTAIWTHEALAMTLVNREDRDGVRGELARAKAAAASCPEGETELGVFAAAHVADDREVPELRARIARLRAAPLTPPGGRVMLDHIEGRLMLPRDRAVGERLLEAAIAGARALPANDVNARKARSYSYSLLVLDAGSRGDWPAVWKLLAEDTGIATLRCGLGVAREGQRSVVVVRDGSGALAGEYQSTRTGDERHAARLVPAALSERLRGCSEIDVIARPPLQGAPDLLPSELAWSYRSGAPALGARPATPRGTRLVISNTEPPAELQLPRLSPWRSAHAADVVLEGPGATPSRVLAALSGADFVEIHAHGMVNAAVSDAALLMLSPDAEGRYMLTAAAIRKQPLRRRPVIVLAACHAGATAPYRHAPWGLPAAFVEAGALAVIASPEVIADADAGGFFDLLRAQIERGVSPAVALRDVRADWLAAHPGAAWVRALMVFR